MGDKVERTFMRQAQSWRLSIAEAAQLIRDCRLSPVDLTRECLDRIDRLNPLLNAFITVTREQALKEARMAEAEIRSGHWRGPLHGIPIGLKDLIDTAGVRTTAASGLFKERIPANDADVVQKLRNAGAVFLGKQNLHEFAYGGSSMVSFFGEIHNPWNLDFIAGGSSGGSAAAVSAGLSFAAIGTDTAGSIREPAAQCGIVGLKPTYGGVSLDGVIPLSHSLDHAGPLTRTVEDAALILEVIADNKVHLGWPSRLRERLNAATRTLKIGVPRKFFFEELDRDVAAALEGAVDVITGLVASTQEIVLEVDTDRTLQAAESYQFHRQWIEKSSGLYQPETLRRILSGKDVADEDIQRLRHNLNQSRTHIASVFEQVDLLITPTTPIPARRISDLQKNPDQLRPAELALLRNTRPFNVWGLPAISVPCGFSADGLPVGLQIAGPLWGEKTILHLAHAYERATEWHKLWPALAG